MLPINHSRNTFFRIDVQEAKNIPREVKEIIRDINESWEDIEHLNYLFHITFSKLSDDDKNISFNMDTLLTITKSFYVHLDIINKSLEKIEKMDIGHSSKLIKMNRRKRFLQLISVVRNNVVIHKEKSDFIRPNGVMSATDPKILYEHVLVTVDDSGTKKSYPLRPLKHAEMMKKLLTNLQQLLLQD